MRKAAIGFTAAAALAATTFAPAPAKALDPISAWWLIPAVLGGIVVGTAATRPVVAAPRGAVYGYDPHYYQPAPRGYVYAEPRGQVYARKTVRSRY